MVRIIQGKKADLVERLEEDDNTNGEGDKKKEEESEEEEKPKKGKFKNSIFNIIAAYFIKFYVKFP